MDNNQGKEAQNYVLIATPNILNLELQIERGTLSDNESETEPTYISNAFEFLGYIDAETKEDIINSVRINMEKHSRSLTFPRVQKSVH